PSLAGIGTHTISYSLSRSQCLTNNPATTTVTVTAPPIVNITSAPGTGCNGGNVNVILTANSSTGVSYQWYYNGSAISGATSQTLNVNKSGWYNVVVSSNGCSSDSLNTGKVVNLLNAECGHDTTKKTVICHVPDCRYDKAVTICIGNAAVPAHLA